MVQQLHWNCNFCVRGYEIFQHIEILVDQQQEEIGGTQKVMEAESNKTKDAVMQEITNVKEIGNREGKLIAKQIHVEYFMQQKFQQAETVDVRIRELEKKVDL